MLLSVPDVRASTPAEQLVALQLCEGHYSSAQGLRKTTKVPFNIMAH